MMQLNLNHIKNNIQSVVESLISEYTNTPFYGHNM